MLVLSRKKHEQIHIGQNIVLKVVKVGRRTVSIGIEAPKNVRIVRGELMEIPEHGDVDEATAPPNCPQQETA